MIAEKVRYKKTGIDWMPEVPEHWGVVRLKNVTKIVSGATPKSSVSANWDGNINWVTPAEFGDEIFIGESVRKITKTGLESCAATLVPVGSIIISNRAPIGSLGISKVELCTNQGCKAIIPTNINNYFLYFVMSLQKENLNVLGNGTTFRELATPSLRNYKIPLPPKEEQDQIAGFLYAESAKITRFIQTKQRFIELLKEQRQSIITHAVTKGIDEGVKMKETVLGEIPKNWEVGRLKNYSTIKGRIGFRGYTTSDLVDNGAIVIGATHIKNGLVDLSNPTYLSWEKYYESPEIMVCKGDILVVQRGSCGVIGYVQKDFGKVTINPSVVLVKEIQINEEFLNYFLQSNIIAEEIKISVSQTAVPMISQFQIGNFRVVNPPIEEQKRIVNYIKSETHTLDIAISKAEREIELIKEYREAMIAEAVTGKMKMQ